MNNLETAVTEIKKVEAILRRRYQYPHPILGYVTVALECLEMELAALRPPAPDPEAGAEAQAEAVEKPPTYPSRKRGRS